MGVCLLRAVVDAIAGKLSDLRFNPRGGQFPKFWRNHIFITFSGRYNSNSENVGYLFQSKCCNKKYVDSIETKFRQRLNLSNHISDRTRANIMKALSTGGIYSIGNYFWVIFRNKSSRKIWYYYQNNSKGRKCIFTSPNRTFWQCRQGICFY